MRQDIIYGVAISALIHAGAFFSPGLFPRHAPLQKLVVAKPPGDFIVMRKLDDDDPPPPDQSDEIDKTVDIPPPPSQVDVPQVVPEQAFVQHLQPPPPEGFKPSDGMYRIPESRPGTGFKTLQPIDARYLDQQPVARVKTPPSYPFEMRQGGMTGTVIVDFIVDTNGNVLNAHAIQSTQREFESAAVLAVSKWKFRPGMKAGRIVSSHLQVPIVFSLNNEI